MYPCNYNLCLLLHKNVETVVMGFKLLISGKFHKDPII